MTEIGKYRVCDLTDATLMVYRDAINDEIKERQKKAQEGTLEWIMSQLSPFLNTPEAKGEHPITEEFTDDLIAIIHEIYAEVTATLEEDEI